VVYLAQQPDPTVDPVGVERSRVAEADSFTFIDVERGDPDDQDWDLFAEASDGVL
jgi:hypothetical protein